MRATCAIGVVAVLLLASAVRGEEPRKDANGDPLPEHVVLRLGGARFRQPLSGSHLAFSPDSKRLVAIGGDESLRIWEVPSGKLVALTKMPYRRGYDMEALACSGDGKLIAVSKFEGMQLLDASSGAVVRNVGDRGDACGLALSSDGSVLAVADLGGGVCALNTTSGKSLLRSTAGGLNERFSVTVSPDGTRLLAYSSGGKARLWNLEGGKEETPGHPEMKDSTAGAFSADGRRLALADGKGVVRVYEGDHEPVELGKVEGGVFTLEFLQDGDTLSAVGSAYVLARWSLKSRERQKDVALKHAIAPRGYGYLPCVAISRDGRYVAQPGVAIQLWDAATGEMLSPREGGTEGSCGMALSPNDELVAAGSEDGSVDLWSLETGKCVGHHSVDGEYAYPTPVGFTATGEALIVNTHEAGIRVLRVPDLTLIRSIDDARQGAIGLLDGGRMAVIGSVWKGGLAILDLRDGSITKRPEGERVEGFAQVVVTPDQNSVAYMWMTSSNKEHSPIRVHSVQSGRLLWELPASLCLDGSFSFSPDGARLISSDLDKKAKAWSAATGKPVSDEEAAADEDEPVAELAVDMSEEGILTVRRADKKDVVWKADPGCGEINGAAYTADGRKLITLMGDGTILVWDLGGTAVAPPPTLDDPMEKVWEMLGSSNTWDASRASATLAARGDKAVAFLKGRLSSPPPEEKAQKGPPELAWTPEGLSRLRGIWALGRIATPAARELLQAVASASKEGREAGAARATLERLK